MAKRKGKSQRRIKGWQQRLAAGEELDRTARRQGFSQRAVKLPADRLAAPEENLEELPKREGLVVGFFPGGVIVRADDQELLCGIAKTFRAPADASALAVGDEVTAAITRPNHADGQVENDRERADGMIVSRQPRRTVLSRPQPRSGKRSGAYEAEVFEKVIAANIDVLVIVASTREPPLRSSLIDRYLIIAERGKLKPLLAINKIDLARADEKVLADLRALELETVLTSAVTGQGLEDLRAALLGRRSVLAGASGVGKSTLINALVPEADAATRAIRMKDQRGRHTTSAAVVYDLPKGGVIIDTPGIRELGVGLKAGELPWYFPEFEPLSPQCKFNNCTHTHEPDCAVVRAVEEGNILPRRYESYLRILESLKGNPR